MPQDFCLKIEKDIIVTDQRFTIIDLIFVKVKGYLHWPSKIIIINKHSYRHVTKYKVNFCATNETLNVNLIKHNICHYFENRKNYPLETTALRHRGLFKKSTDRYQERMG